ncbi:RNA guanine-N7 methyltransferase activating subunit-like [Gouania willdenowi]|uniref:RNA guanine-N7 methyltransferase activating subunit-like n=1 Tax=Gouania willdenowi TaxID=441366 RepID=UPI00105608C2|nr:RNA guanine-N7 methyltransferase activating subunit [Gouania willdenowi]XP_028297662.1 RNA guanine-N7 methyltransferase activating subunit [Gouania willdenowi]
MTESKENTQSYEEMFAKRFTAEDEEYQKYVNRPTDPPPIVENWRGRGGGNHRGRDYRYRDRHGQGRHEGHGGYSRRGGRDWGGDRAWRGNYRGQQQQSGYDRDRHDKDRHDKDGYDRDRHDKDGYDRDRQWGHGSGYQSGHRSSNQGHSSDHQRFPKDCY